MDESFDIIFKMNSRRNVLVHLRDLLGINALEQVKLKEMTQALDMIDDWKSLMIENSVMTPERVQILAESEVEVVMEIDKILRQCWRFADQEEALFTKALHQREYPRRFSKLGGQVIRSCME